jgi:thymidylate synthase (FAD)
MGRSKRSTASARATNATHAQRPRKHVTFRPIVPQLEHLLHTAIPVLDKGFVRVIDYMGDDAAVVQAARVSYGTGTKRIHDNRALIRYLMRHLHTTPFEMCEIKLHLRVPMDTWRQWIRHRTANVNEYSTRYSLAIDAAQRTQPDEWRRQSQDNRQGSDGNLSIEAGKRLSAAEGELQGRARAVYEERIAAGIAREQARKDLPLSTYTEAYWKIDLHNLLNFLNLRMSDHAQQEIRAYANIIGKEVVARWTPITWEAFLDYRRNAMQLSNVEMKIVSALATGDHAAAQNIAAQYGMLNRTPDGGLKSNRERKELELKLAMLGLTPCWK